MLSVNEFVEEMKAAVTDWLPEDLCQRLTINPFEVTKINDQKQHGLNFVLEGKQTAPTVYLDNTYKAYLRGENISYLAYDLAEYYMQVLDVDAPADPDLSFDSIKDCLTVRLMDMNRNREFLSDKPYMDMGNGLALIADINIKDGNDAWRMAVSNDVLELIGRDRDTVFDAAIVNSARIDPPYLVDVSKAMLAREQNLLDRMEPLPPEEKPCMYMLSNFHYMNGAASMYLPNVMKRAGEVIGEDFYILPSSIHEVMLVPESGNLSEFMMYHMVKSANDTVVKPQDVLSDYVFHYNRSSGVISTVHPELS